MKNRYLGATARVGRWDGIQQAVEERQLTDYRILDDKEDEFPAGLPHLILCDPDEGVYDHAVQEKLREWLGQARP